MYQNPMFRNADTNHTIDVARERGFGMLAVNGTNAPIAVHLPFVISEDGSYLEAHTMRTNLVLRELDSPKSALLSVNGPDAYISPDWYGVEDQVPTWNYVAVHLRGTLTRLPQDDLRGILDRISAHFETQLAPKPVWTADKMTPGVMEKMMRAIVPIRMEIETADSTWKLGQNKTDAARDGAADGVEAAGIGQDTQQIAALMRDIKDTK